MPQERKTEGLLLDKTIRVNMTLDILRRLAGIAGLIDREQEQRLVAAAIERFHIEAGSTQDRVRTLSGGNQQKVLLEKRLETLLAEQRAALDPWTPERYTEANVRFHAAIFELADNQFVSGQLPLVRITAQVFAPNALLSRERVYTAIAEHVAILEAITQGDAARAETLARNHIRHSITELNEKGAAAGPPGARQPMGSKTT